MLKGRGKFFFKGIARSARLIVKLKHWVAMSTKNLSQCFALLPMLLVLAATFTITQAIERNNYTSVRDKNPNDTTGSFALEAMHDNFTCIAGCNCQLVDITRSRYAVLCQGSSIRSIPAFLTEDLHQIVSMTLLRTSITKIDSLRMFSNLVHLNLNQSLVRALDSGLVTTFPALESLHIAGSRLAQLTDFSLMRHPALRDVDFSANQLDSFVSAGSMSLKSLRLRENLFTRLDSVSVGYVALNMLDAARNRLTLSGLLEWQPPSELEVLDLSGNQLGLEAGTTLRHTNASFLTRLRRLQQLDLSDNRLTSLQAITDWLPADARLWKLSLAGNPFLCTCGLYRDKERLARQGVVIADTPTCRLSNGSDCPLMRLGSWACDEDAGGGGGDGGNGGPTKSPDELASAALLSRLPTLLGVTAAAVAIVILAAAAGVWACQRSRRRSQERQRRSGQQELDAEYPYAVASVKSTNLTGSQMSVATYRSGGLPYALDPQRSRVFSKKLHPPTSEMNLLKQQQQQQQQKQQDVFSRCQSEQILGGLGRTSTPLPPIPDAATASAAAQQAEQQRPEAYSYIDMAGSPEGYQDMQSAGDEEVSAAAYAYDELQPRTERQKQEAAAVTEGYVDMRNSSVAV